MSNESEKYVFDKTLAEQFEKYMKKYPEIYRSLAKIVKINMPESSNNQIIVDLGSGPGLLSLELHDKISNTKIIGLDPSPNMLKVALKNVLINNYKRCEFVLSKSENIPLTENSTDIVVIRFSLYSWKMPKNSMKEIYRILRPGGKIIIEALNADFPKWKLILIKLHMAINAAGKYVIKYHINSYKTAKSAIQTERLLSDAGFEIIKKENKRNDWKFLIIAEKP